MREKLKKEPDKQLYATLIWLLLFLTLLRNPLLASVKLCPPFGIIPTENSPAMLVYLKPHFGEQLLKGDLQSLQKPQHSLLRHQKMDQVGLDALWVVHIVDILVPGTGVVDKPLLKLEHFV